MIEECPMRHENGNCQPAGGFCTAVREITCEALQNAYQMGYMDMGNRAKAEDVVKVVRCKDCKHSVQNKYATAPNYNYFCAKTSTATHIDYHSENWFCADGERRESDD